MKACFNDLINEDQPILVDFFAEWCNPCKMQTAVLHQIIEHYKDKIRIVKVNVDTNKALAKKYQIGSIPTLFLFRRGELLWNKKGLAEKDELIGLLDLVK